MNTAVVITTVASPTTAVRAFAARAGLRVYVVGDRKTPMDWHCPGATYMPVAQQSARAGALARRLPWNHYCRKMLGYLAAIDDDCGLIVDTDDDNLPKDDWGFPPLSGRFDAVPDHQGFVNVYQLFTRQTIWPRGLPLRLITHTSDLASGLSPARAEVGVWQGLADGDPDVDAVYRLVYGARCQFDARAPVVLGRGTLSPYNTQNTLTRRELFPLLYLPVTVSFRFTDILRSWVAQPIMWAAGYCLGFTQATVTQERNCHDNMVDFAAEVPMYLHTERVVERVTAAVSPGATVAENLMRAYGSLVEAQVVTEAEIACVQAWLSDLAAAAAGTLWH